jgi:hypothetical protein
MVLAAVNSQMVDGRINSTSDSNAFADVGIAECDYSAAKACSLRHQVHQLIAEVSASSPLAPRSIRCAIAHTGLCNEFVESPHEVVLRLGSERCQFTLINNRVIWLFGISA